MLRTNGAFTFFVIQHYQPPSPDGSIAGKWMDSNLDHFGHPPGFTASSPCWQKLGVHGCFESEEAMAGILTMKSNWPNHKFRIARYDVIQQCTTIEFEKP